VYLSSTDTVLIGSAVVVGREPLEVAAVGSAAGSAAASAVLAAAAAAAVVVAVGSSAEAIDALFSVNKPASRSQIILTRSTTDRVSFISKYCW